MHPSSSPRSLEHKLVKQSDTLLTRYNAIASLRYQLDRLPPQEAKVHMEEVFGQNMPAFANKSDMQTYVDEQYAEMKKEALREIQSERGSSKLGTVMNIPQWRGGQYPDLDSMLHKGADLENPEVQTLIHELGSQATSDLELAILSKDGMYQKKLHTLDLVAQARQEIARLPEFSAFCQELETSIDAFIQKNVEAVRVLFEKHPNVIGPGLGMYPFETDEELGKKFAGLIYGKLAKGFGADKVRIRGEDTQKLRVQFAMNSIVASFGDYDGYRTNLPKGASMPFSDSLNQGVRRYPTLPLLGKLMKDLGACKEAMDMFDPLQTPETYPAQMQELLAMLPRNENAYLMDESLSDQILPADKIADRQEEIALDTIMGEKETIHTVVTDPKNGIPAKLQEIARQEEKERFAEEHNVQILRHTELEHEGYRGVLHNLDKVVATLDAQKPKDLQAVRFKTEDQHGQQYSAEVDVLLPNDLYHEHAEATQRQQVAIEKVQAELVDVRSQLATTKSGGIANVLSFGGAKKKHEALVQRVATLEAELKKLESEYSTLLDDISKVQENAKKFLRDAGIKGAWNALLWAHKVHMIELPTEIAKSNDVTISFQELRKHIDTIRVATQHRLEANMLSEEEKKVLDAYRQM